MLRKRWLMIVTATGLVAAAVTGGVVLAQGIGSGGDTSRDQVLERVAGLLDIEQVELEAAFDQARGEQADEEITRLLEDLVAAGKLTEDEASAIRTWLDSRPESVGEIDARLLRQLVTGEGSPLPRLRAFAGAFALPKIGSHSEAGELPEEDASAILEWIERFPESLAAFRFADLLAFARAQVERRQAGDDPFPPTVGGLVEAGILTEEQANDIESWRDSRPDSAPGVVPHFPGFQTPFGKGFFFQGWQGRTPERPRLHRGFRGFRFAPHGEGARLPELGPFGREGSLLPEHDELMERLEEFRADGNLDGFFEDLRKDLQERFDAEGVGGGMFRFKFDLNGEKFDFEYPPDEDDETPEPVEEDSA